MKGFFVASKRLSVIIVDKINFVSIISKMLDYISIEYRNKLDFSGNWE